MDLCSEFLHKNTHNRIRDYSLVMYVVIMGRSTTINAQKRTNVRSPLHYQLHRHTPSTNAIIAHTFQRINQ